MAASPRLLVLEANVAAAAAGKSRYGNRPFGHSTDTYSQRPRFVWSVKKLRTFSRLAAAYIRRQGTGFQVLMVGAMQPIVHIVHRRQVVETRIDLDILFARL